MVEKRKTWTQFNGKKSWTQLNYNITFEIISKLIDVNIH